MVRREASESVPWRFSASRRSNFVAAGEPLRGARPEGGGHRAEMLQVGSCRQAKGLVTVRKVDGWRAAAFFVESFYFRGLHLTSPLPGEPEILEEMLGTPIDPDILRSAPSVADALAAIATNTSNAVAARLFAVFKHAGVELMCRADGYDVYAAPRGPAPVLLEEAEPASLLTLPAALIHDILSARGSLREAVALGCTCRAMQLVLEPGVLLPVWSAPGRGSCDNAVVAWDAAAGTLRKTARYGNPLVVFEGRMRAGGPGALLELELERFEVGCLQLGVVAVRRGSPPTTSEEADRTYFDTAGRVRTRGGAPIAYGERCREGDRLGIYFCATDADDRGVAARAAIGYTLNGQAIGPMVLLPDGADFFFFARIDVLEGQQIRLRRERRGPTDMRALARAAATYAPRPVAEKALIVRTIGPDSRAFSVALNPKVATVGELRERVAKLVDCDEYHWVQLRIDGLVIAIEENGTRLEEHGVAIEDNGCNLADILVSIPHLIS